MTDNKIKNGTEITKTKLIPPPPTGINKVKKSESIIQIKVSNRFLKYVYPFHKSHFNSLIASLDIQPSVSSVN